MSAAAASALAQTLSTHGDETIQQAVMLLVSQRPALHGLLLEALQEPPAQRFTGTIKTFWPEKRFGFIDCNEIKDMFNADVFLSDQEIGPFSVGSTVTFSVMLNKAGRPQAKLLEAAAENPPAKRRAVVPPPQRQTPPPAAAPVQPPTFQQPPQQQPQAQPQKVWINTPPAPIRPAEPANEEEELYVGQIKNFWPDKHYGFIACEVFKACGNCDVFLSDHEILDFNVGDWVSFNVAYNKNGQPQAHGLQAAADPEAT